MCSLALTVFTPTGLDIYIHLICVLRHVTAHVCVHLHAEELKYMSFLQYNCWGERK